MNLGRGWYYQILILVVFTDECVFYEKCFPFKPYKPLPGYAHKVRTYGSYFLLKYGFVLFNCVLLLLYIFVYNKTRWKKLQEKIVHGYIFLREFKKYFQPLKRQ